MEIAHVITISTAHVSKETASRLDDADGFSYECWLSIYNKQDYGWWILVDSADLEADDMPDDLAACICLARKYDCEWLCLDCDAEVLETLPTYDW
jgi:hypothetical protein